MQIVRLQDTDLYAFLLPPSTCATCPARPCGGWSFFPKPKANQRLASALQRQTTPPLNVHDSFFTSMKLHFASCRDFGYSNDILFAFFTIRKVQPDHCNLVINFPLFPPSNNICHVAGMSSNLVSTIISPPVVSILPSLIHPLRSEMAWPARSR